MQIDVRIVADDLSMYKNSFNGIHVNDATFNETYKALTSHLNRLFILIIGFSLLYEQLNYNNITSRI